MKKKIKGFYLIVSSFIIAILHLPFAFAKSAAGSSKLFFQPPAGSKSQTTAAPVPLPAPAPIPPVVKSVYDSLHLSLKGMSLQAFEFAKEGMQKLLAEGKLLNDSIISIVDFSLPSNQKRLFVLDLKNYKVLFNSLVAHGQNTGRERAVSFSNQNESHKSSLGFYITMQTYEGGNGYSLKLEGMEPGLNDKAYERGIVMHGAEYVSQELANARGWVGRSHGCPAVPTQLNRPIINTIKGGSCFFIYHPDYISRSQLLN
jgi:L,D-transpeptidase catalytic domain